MTSSVGLRIEATEFPGLVQRYGVMGVPKIVINERVEVEGAVPEHAMLEMIFAAAEARAGRAAG
jgi:predicted DsbA family dithiol-disulfide isomerase